MPINQTNQVDYLFKKIGYGVTTTANANVKSPSNETIASPLTLRGDTIWINSSQIPATQPGASAGVVTVYSDANTNSVKTTNDGTAPPYQTWNTGITNWIDPSFGSTYAVKVYYDSTTSTTPQSTGTQLFPDGTGNDDEWFFDYNSGVLTFPDNIPASVNGVTGKTIFIIGATFTGLIGLANIASVITGTVNTANVALLANVTQTVSGNVYYPALFASNVSGNLAQYVNGNISYVPNVANLTVAGNVISTFYGNINGIQANITGNLYAGNIYIIGAQTLTDMTASGNISANNFLAKTNFVGNLVGNVTGTTGTFSSNIYAYNLDGNVHGNVYSDYILSNLTNVVTFAIPTAIGLPTGGDASRPGSASAGQLRYNSDRLTLEFYNGSGWVDLTSIITVQQFNGDGVNATFNLNSVVTGPEAILVNINGTVQQPGIAYTVATVGGVSQITFAETPQPTDAIDIRFLSTGAETLNMSQYIGNVGIQGVIGVQGNIVPSATNTYFIGNSSNQWDGVYSNVINVTTGIYWANGAPYSSVPGSYLATYLPTDPTIQSIQSNITAIGLLSNANIGTLYTGNITTQANLGAFQIYANANATAQALAINSLATNANANTMAYLSTASIITTGNIQAGNITVTGNITSVNYETITYTEIANVILASGNISTTAYIISPSYLYSNGVNILNSVGAYQIWANANVAGLQNQITGANTNIQNISANLGAYEIWNNANASTMASAISTLQANVGAYETWANVQFASSIYSNSNVTSYFAAGATGNIVLAGNTTIQQTRELYSAVSVDGASSVTLNYYNGAVFYITGQATGNYTAAFTNIPTAAPYVITTSLIIIQGSTPYLPTNISINGASQTINWPGGLAPIGVASHPEVVSFTFVVTSSNTFTVLGSFTDY
jgi:hypothetical protein